MNQLINLYNFDYAFTQVTAGPHAVTGLTSTTGTLLPANDQIVDYTAFSKASHIGQGGYDYFITYGTDRQRSMSRLINGITEDILQTKYYAFGDYEKEITLTGTRHLHYISGGDGLAAIYVKYSNAPDSLYFITSDHLGSIVGAINSTTGTIFKQNFDAWGRKRNPQTWSYTNIPDFPFDRGYTGHEHLKWFGLINMNGRMYDAAICRFLSPDPYVQMPDYTQNFNRYSYALNNPLVYSDPSGYWFGLDDAVVAGAGFLFGYLSYGITQGDWGGKALLSGGIGALTAWVGYNTAGLAYGCVDKVTMNYVGSMAINTVAGQIIPPMNIPVGDNISLSVSPGIGMSSGGSLVGGLNFSGTYTSGDWAFTAGHGVGNTHNSMFGSATYYDRANSQYFSYYATYFGGQYKQTVGGLGYSKGDFSIRFENDFFAHSGDKYRTNAIEFGLGDFVMGTNLWTNNPDPNNENKDWNPDGTNLRGKTNKHGNGAWNNGQVLSAPLYFGYSQGNAVTRAGISNPWVQDRTQNFIHKNFLPGYQHFYNNYDNMKQGPWSYSGYYNPFTLN